jgi:hypothetical protein
MIRRFVLATGLIAAAMASPSSLNGQIGLHVARASDAFGGTNGLGASVGLGIPTLPIDVFLAGDYFFPDCGTGDGCSFRGGSLDLHLKVPFPVVQLYGAGGLVVRRTDAGDGSESVTHRGFGAGLGVDLGAILIGAYAEGRYEFVDPDDQFVLRLGIRF